MKPKRTFKQRWNKTALKRIKKEFLANPKHCYLCNVSMEFEALWKIHEKEITQLMFQHFPEEKAWNELRHSDGSLFYNDDTRENRIKFLDLEIKRLEQLNKKPTP